MADRVIFWPRFLLRRCFLGALLAGNVALGPAAAEGRHRRLPSLVADVTLGDAALGVCGGLSALWRFATGWVGAAALEGWRPGRLGV
jgi:hypothetical protein